MALFRNPLFIIGCCVLAAGAAGFIVYWFFLKGKYFKKTQDNESLEFAQNAKVFSGLYEPVYLMGFGKVKFKIGVVGDWVTRTKHLETAPLYRDKWLPILEGFESWDPETGKNHLQQLYKFISASGVLRDKRKSFKVNSETYSRYAADDGELIEQGNTAYVKTPCWYIGDIILDKGIIQRNKQEVK